MGMFDSLYDADGNEWQTKAYDCTLDVFSAGAKMPTLHDCPPEFQAPVPPDYQVEVYGGPGDGYTDAYATVRTGVLVAVGVERDPALPLVDYGGCHPPRG